MNRRLRAVLVLALLFSSLAFAGEPLRSRAVASPAPQGRLGGSAASFADRFGPPVIVEGATRSYRAKGYAAITVRFDHDRAVAIVVMAARGAAWSTSEARAVIRRFLPADAALDPTRYATGDGRWALACASRALAQTFSRADYRRLKHAGRPGECFALASPDALSTIGAIEISIGRAGALARAIDVAAASTPTAATPTPAPLVLPPPAPAQTTASTLRPPRWANLGAWPAAVARSG